MSDPTKASALIVAGFCLFVALLINHTPSTSNDFSWQKTDPTKQAKAKVKTTTRNQAARQTTRIAKIKTRQGSTNRQSSPEQKATPRIANQVNQSVRPLPQANSNHIADIASASFVQNPTTDRARLSQAASQQQVARLHSNRIAVGNQPQQNSLKRYPGLPVQDTRPKPGPQRIVNHAFANRSVAPASHTDTEDSFLLEDLDAARPLNSEIETQQAPPTVGTDVNVAAMERVRYGKSLARRGAFFAARDEFFNAMYLVAESHDRTTSTSSYSRRLKLGLQALEEVGDFGKVSRAVQSSQPQRFVLSSHNTKLIKPEDAENYTRSQLIDLYCQFAESQIQAAIGNSPAASEALFAYGKILVAQAKDWQHQDYIDAQICWTIFKASFAANANNHQTANELGIRHLKSGQFETAIEHFSTAIKIANRSVYWSNLAEAHRQIADATNLEQEKNTQLRLAHEALERARLAANNLQPQRPEKWVSAQQFDHQGAMPDLRHNATPRQATAPAPAEQDSRPNAQRGLLKNIKKWF